MRRCWRAFSLRCDMRVIVLQSCCTHGSEYGQRTAQYDRERCPAFRAQINVRRDGGFNPRPRNLLQNETAWGCR